MTAAVIDSTGRRGQVGRVGEMDEVAQSRSRHQLR